MSQLWLFYLQLQVLNFSELWRKLASACYTFKIVRYKFTILRKKVTIMRRKLAILTLFLKIVSISQNYNLKSHISRFSPNCSCSSDYFSELRVYITPFLLCNSWLQAYFLSIYIYAFSRCFYPKRLTIAFRLYIFISMCVPWESNPQPLALLTQCFTTEPYRNTYLTIIRKVSELQEIKVTINHFILFVSVVETGVHNILQK